MTTDRGVRKNMHVTTNFSAGLLLLLTLMLPALGNSQAVDDAATLLPLTDEVATALDTRLLSISSVETDIANLKSRAETSEGLAAEILGLRGDRMWTALFHDTVDLARDIADHRDGGDDVAVFIDPLADKLKLLSGEAHDAINRMLSAVVFPSKDLSPDEFVIADQHLFRQVHTVDDLFRALIKYVGVADRFDLDSTNINEFLELRLQESAESRSVFLEMAIENVEVLRASVLTLPDNADLANWLRAAETRVTLTATAMQESIDLLDSLEIESRFYRKQMLSVTGEITTDVFDVGILANFASEWTQQGKALIASEGPKLFFRLLLAVGIVLISLQLAKLVRKGAEQALKSNLVYVSNLLRRMIIGTVGNVVIFIGFLIAGGQLGISFGPLLAGFGIAGFIIGFALQDTLSNFASGVMILFYRPFDVGDVVDAAGVNGKVSHMSLVNTTFMTFDNQRLIVPNNQIWGAVITNLTAQKTRRIDLVFNVGYDDDIAKVEKILHAVVTDHKAVLDDPEPNIRLNNLGDSSMDFIVRPWVKTSDYWETYWDLMRAVKLKFDEEGISIPYPQQDLHISKDEVVK